MWVLLLLLTINEETRAYVLDHNLNNSECNRELRRMMHNMEKTVSLYDDVEIGLTCKFVEKKVARSGMKKKI